MPKNKLRSTVTISLFGALICIVSPWAIPFSVPITLASFAVYLTSATLGVRRGAGAVILYILIGAVGVPVFSGFRGGIASLLGPTGGFIVGYIPCALMCAFGADLFSGRASRLARILANALSMVVGTVLLYAVGLFWYMFTTGTAFSAAFMICVLTFIPVDALKIIIASALSVSLKERLKQIGI